MTKFENYLNESYILSFKNRNNFYVEIFKNPAGSDIRALLKAESDSLRMAVVGAKKNFFIWSYQGLHEEVLPLLHKKGEWEPAIYPRETDTKNWVGEAYIEGGKIVLIDIMKHRYRKDEEFRKKFRAEDWSWLDKKIFYHPRHGKKGKSLIEFMDWVYSVNE